MLILEINFIVDSIDKFNFLFFDSQNTKTEKFISKKVCQKKLSKVSKIIFIVASTDKFHYLFCNLKILKQ